MDLTYAPLPKGNFVRLLEVNQDPLTHEVVSRFKVVCIDICNDKYTAISYAWGHQAPASRLMFSDGQSFPLSLTLSTLFTSLQEKATHFTLWIDAICINQNDTAEKECQVRLMGQIYSCAEQVLIWLGESNPKTQETFRLMEKQAPSGAGNWDAVKYISKQDYLFTILEQLYFQRVWVIQEITLGDKVVLACGRDRIEFDRFRTCVFALWRLLEDWENHDDDSDAIRGLYCVTRLIFIRNEYQKSGSVRYEILLQAALHCQATDYRDMVFAFRGIGDKGRLVPDPDYNASIEDVYIKTASALLCHGTSLDSLALSGTGSRHNPSSLPTWVPELRYYCDDEPFVPCDNASWSAGGPLEISATVSLPDQLHLQARLLDSAEVVCPIFNSNSVPEQKVAMESVLSLRKRLPNAMSKSDWSEMVARSLIFGLDIDDDLAGPEYTKYFNKYLEWLQSSSTQADLAKIKSNPYHRIVGLRINGWKAFMTKKGFFCLGPPEVAIGDLICVVPGCRFPLILRPTKIGFGDESCSRYILISWCFVQGIMHGEATASGHIVDITLC